MRHLRMIVAVSLLMVVPVAAEGFAPTFDREADCATLRYLNDQVKAGAIVVTTPKHRRLERRLRAWYARHCH